MIGSIKRICCIGAGYVGGPTMAVIADKCKNIQVNVVDINEDRINQWNNKSLDDLPIFEPGLSEIVGRCRNKNLFFSNDIDQNISQADLIFISVNTPIKDKGLGAGLAIDLKWVESSARRISKYATGHTIVVEKSTLPVKTARTIKEILDVHNLNSSKENFSRKSFSVLSNPEFLAEGTAIKDLEDPDRVLIGGDDQKAIEALSEVYLKWVKSEKIITTNLWSSELSKLTANAFLAQRISSTNSISAICEATGANIDEVSLAISMDRRIGSKFLKPGPGFGGSCFKKDILNLIYICKYYGLIEVANYWEQVLKINDWQQRRITNEIVRKLYGTLHGKIISIFGFAFKANTNDTRESPAIKICRELLEEGAFLKIYDPKVKKSQIELDLNKKEIKNEKSDLEDGGWIFKNNYLDASIDSDAIVILTEWEEFNNLDWEEISSCMRKPSWVFDTRSIIKLDKLKNSDLKFWGVGYGSNDREF